MKSPPWYDTGSMPMLTLQVAANRCTACLHHHRSGPFGNRFDCTLQQPIVTTKCQVEWKWNHFGRRHDLHWRPLRGEMGCQPKVSRNLDPNPVAFLHSRQVRRRSREIRTGQFLQRPICLMQVAMGHGGTLSAEAHRAKHGCTVALVAKSFGYSRPVADDKQGYCPYTASYDQSSEGET